MTMLNDSVWVREHLAWMRAEGIWPNGLRYLWTDAFGLILLVSLYRELDDPAYLDEARGLVTAVESVLGRERGIRIGEAPERDGQYFHYLAMWIFALARLAEVDPAYRQRGITLVHEIHEHFLVPGRGVHWKMTEDLSRPYPGSGLGMLDAFQGCIAYHALDPAGLSREIADLQTIMDRHYRQLAITQDLALGMMLWMCHFQPEADWSRFQTRRCLAVLDELWNEDGWFSRDPRQRNVRFAFTNYGVAIGLQAIDAGLERVQRLVGYFERYRSGDEYDREAITHVMACSAHFPGLLLSDARRELAA
ncbi:MAG: hypothetical protein ACOCXA_02305 [Planctomycetota bacterium]